MAGSTATTPELKETEAAAAAAASAAAAAKAAAEAKAAASGAGGVTYFPGMPHSFITAPTFTALGDPFADTADAKVDDLHTALLKKEYEGILAANFKKERDIAEARLFPTRVIDRRMTALSKATKTAGKAVSSIIDDAKAAGLPIHQIRQLAKHSANSLVGFSNLQAELEVPSDLAKTAWGATHTGAGAPGAVGAGAAPKKPRAPRKKKTAEEKK